MPILPALPKVELETVREVSQSPSDSGFLTVKRRDLLLVRPDGEKSTTFRYDVVERRALDASVMVAHYTSPDSGQEHVYLRSAVRPPIALRHVEPQLSAVLWEVPAGLIEPGEEARAAAARELDEELGFAVKDEEMLPLGPWSVPAPGFIGEMHWYFHVRVDPTTRKKPGGDGSPLEEVAQIIDVPLDRALQACAAGEIRDAKTEIAIHRLHAELLRLLKNKT